MIYSVFRIKTKEYETTGNNRLYCNLCCEFDFKYESLAESHNKNPLYPCAYLDFLKKM